MALSRRPLQPVRNPLDGTQSIRAVLFDVDGTLYEQSRLRRHMAVELAREALRHPVRAPRTWRALRAFRHAQECLRRQGLPVTPAAQIDMAARTTGLAPAEIGRVADEWIGTRPLRHLGPCRAAGLDALLAFLQERGVGLGVFSDYPASRKLETLGLATAFDVMLCATDEGVNAFKPHPAGFLAAAAALGVPPAAVLMVGDRPDADGLGAAAAGMPAAIVGARWRSRPPAGGCVHVGSFADLQQLLAGESERAP